MQDKTARIAESKAYRLEQRVATLETSGGSPGADGASAYEIAVANGFVGDEATWLASLEGPQGPAGDDGADGPPGAAGPNGVHYPYPVPSGKYATLHLNNAFNSTVAHLGGGNASFAPFIPQRDITVDALAIEVTTAAPTVGSTILLGIYGATSDAKPGLRLAAAPAVSSTTTGDKISALAGPITLTAGTLYFLALAATTSNVTVRAIGAGGAMILYHAGLNAITTFYVFSGGTLPAPAGAVTEFTGSPSNIRLRVA